MIATCSDSFLGYGVRGGRIALEKSILASSAAIFGKGAEDVAACLVLALVKNSGMVVVVDISGGLSQKLSGRIDAYDCNFVMHDCLVLSENGQLHGRLLASAYSAVIDLPPAQEELLNAALQLTALEEGEGSPMGLIPMIAIVEGFRDLDKEELSGRITALKFIESAGDLGVVNNLLRSSFLVDFSHARTPELSNASAAAFLAKLLSTNCAAKPEAVVINGAERLFGSLRFPHHEHHLLTFLLECESSKVYSCPGGFLLDRILLEACPLRFFSSELWNASEDSGQCLHDEESPEWCGPGLHSERNRDVTKEYEVVDR
jgi:hypothetical protein